MITIKDVQHIAELARLGFTGKEIKNFQTELSSILGYVEKLKKVDITGTEPTYHPLKIENATRADEYRKNGKAEAKLLESVPEIKDGYIKVRSVLK